MPRRPNRSLDDVNAAFHRSYDAARGAADQAGAVLVVFVDALVLCTRRGQRRLVLATETFGAVRSAAHLPVGIHSVLYPARPSLGISEVRTLRRMKQAAQGSLQDLSHLQPEVAKDARRVIEASIAFLGETLSRNAVSEAQLTAFARGMGKGLRRLTMHASRAQLLSLDAAVSDVMASLGPRERRALEVVVAGAHQARERSLAMQYFRQRFGERPGAERRVTYGEQVTHAKDAIKLVGTRRLDRTLAEAFFGDARKLQQDVLGDAAAAVLRELPLARPRGDAHHRGVSASGRAPRRPSRARP